MFISEGGEVAWLEERLEKPRYGEMRSTGVMRKIDGEWKIVQFNMTVPVCRTR